ncbi:MAG TPA: polysaccharide biosynthesis/export family protein [Planctomycetaceae bacterium]|jgi:protein involved in polysaccharide export with SLBB domain
MLLTTMIGWLILPVLSGCAMFETPAPLPVQSSPFSAPASTPPTALSWLTNWVSQPIEMAPGFDIESIKPALRPAVVGQDDLLEITIWELYEPGKPYSYPVRVSARHTVEVPLLGEMPVEGRTIAQIESSFVDAFRRGEYLLNPRVLVRSLDAPIVKVQVTGAVNRAGFVELTRSDRSVYAAVLSAGNLKKSSGTQVGVTRRTEVRSSGNITTAPPAAEGPLEQSVIETFVEPNTPHAPEQRANSVEDLSVPAATPVVRPSAGSQPLFSVGDSAADRTGISAVGTAVAGKGPVRRAAPAITRRSGISNDMRQAKSRQLANGPGANGPGAKGLAASGAGAHPAAGTGDQSIVWYDVALAHDREQLKNVVLAEGDIVTIKESAPPLKIEGIVNRPGAYPLPPGHNLNAWQALELAGGVRDETIPLNITLLRPAGDGHGARRWYLNVVEYRQHPTSSPLVEPGDVLQVEPTAGSKIKRVVGDLWSKP